MSLPLIISLIKQNPEAIIVYTVLPNHNLHHINDQGLRHNILSPKVSLKSKNVKLATTLKIQICILGHQEKNRSMVLRKIKIIYSCCHFCKYFVVLRIPKYYVLTPDHFYEVNYGFAHSLSSL